MEGCIFCAIAKDKEKFICESELSYAIFDIKPITKGHALVIPKKHFENLSVTDDEYLQDTVLLAKKVAFRLKEIYPDIKGFKYLSNQGILVRRLPNKNKRLFWKTKKEFGLEDYESFV
ncbi:uncharacterized 16.1 kDa HIT-like protein [Rattus rattus]|uniref:uncharacterized 16.1 kDa HIT-like protein n=1 Tax=Rattus rattus TaxID=10117 RepID=UPI0013F36BAA|nr:uncharacterized 16.1 kDa HIT-like protein [Rattus rattus]